HRRVGLPPRRATLIRVGLPMGVESLIGAAAGRLFAGSTSAEVLKLVLGMILQAALQPAGRRFESEYRKSSSDHHRGFWRRAVPLPSPMGAFSTRVTIPQAGCSRSDAPFPLRDGSGTLNKLLPSGICLTCIRQNGGLVQPRAATGA